MKLLKLSLVNQGKSKRQNVISPEIQHWYYALHPETPVALLIQVTPIVAGGVAAHILDQLFKGCKCHAAQLARHEGGDGVEKTTDLPKRFPAFCGNQILPSLAKTHKHQCHLRQPPLRESR